jgi:hypothetical protein
LQLGFNIQPRHHPIENIRSRQLVSYPFILLSMMGVTDWQMLAVYLAAVDLP